MTKTDHTPAPTGVVSDGSQPYPVRATAVGYFGGSLVHQGAVFLVKSDQDFATWMEPVNEVDRLRLASRIADMERRRVPRAAPGTRPTPAMNLI